MNAFHSFIFIRNTVAEYEIFQLGNKFKALLITQNSAVFLPYQLTFWKEGGKWRTYQPLDEHALYQFGNHIDNHELSLQVARLKNPIAA